MNYAIHRISLDVTDDSPSQLTIAAKQGDNAKRLIITLLDDKKNYQIAEGCYATFIAKKPNGNWLNHTCIIQDNKVIYDFQESTVSTKGMLSCEILLFNKILFSNEVKTYTLIKNEYGSYTTVGSNPVTYVSTKNADGSSTAQDNLGNVYIISRNEDGSYTANRQYMGAKTVSVDFTVDENEDGTFAVKEISKEVYEKLTTATFCIAVHETLLLGIEEENESNKDTLSELIVKGNALIVDLEEQGEAMEQQSEDLDQKVDETEALIEEIYAKLENGEFNGDVIVDVHGVEHKIWLGTIDEFNAIETKDPTVIYLFTDDPTVDEIMGAIATVDGKVNAVNTRVTEVESRVKGEIIEGLENGNFSVSHAVTAGSADKAVADTDGNMFTVMYVKKADIENGTIVAGKAKRDSDGNLFNVYAKKTDLGCVWYTGDEVAVVAKALADKDGNRIDTTYVKKSDLNSGRVVAGKVYSYQQVTNSYIVSPGLYCVNLTTDAKSFWQVFLFIRDLNTDVNVRFNFGAHYGNVFFNSASKAIDVYEIDGETPHENVFLGNSFLVVKTENL